MALKSWIPIIILFILASLTYMFVKKIFKIAYRIVTIIVVVNIIFAIMIYADTRDIQTSLPVEDKTFFLADDNSHTLIAGFTLNEEKSEFLSELDSLNYAAKDFDRLLGDKYKIIIFDKTKLDNFDSIEVGDIRLNQEESLDLLNSNNALLDLTELYNAKMGFDNNEAQALKLKNINDDNEAKALVFFAIAKDMLNKKGLMRLLQEDQVQIHPETITFKLIKHLPDSLLKFVITENEVNALGTN